MSHQNPRLGASRLARGEGPREPEGLSLRPSAVQEEPVSLSEAESFLRAMDTQRSVLYALLQAVRTEGERLSHRLFTRREVEAEWDVFYRQVDLPRPPIGSVSSVEKYDDGAWESISEYDVRGRRLELEDDLPGQPLRVTYTAGYKDLPAELRRQVLLDVRHAYDHRDPTMGEVVQKPDVYAQYRPY